MLEIIVEETEMFDDNTQSFIYIKPTKLVLEHSLVSISKWESKHHKPFLEDMENHTQEELLDYIKCMTITQNVDPVVYLGISQENTKAISDYMNDTMTATWFKTTSKPGGREIVTSELIYYWMIALQIPMECQKWHINRLLTLIKVCNAKQENPKKMSKSAIRSQNAALNRARRAKHGTKG